VQFYETGDYPLQSPYNATNFLQPHSLKTELIIVNWPFNRSTNQLQVIMSLNADPAVRTFYSYLRDIHFPFPSKPHVAFSTPQQMQVET
jgi:hypothetical protein